MIIFSSYDECKSPVLLADNQQSIWFDQIVHAHSPMYNIGGSVTIFGTVDPLLLQESLQQLVNESQALRLRIESTDGVPKQSERTYLQLELPVIDFSKSADAAGNAEKWLITEFQKPFIMHDDTVFWCFALVKISDKKFVLLTKYHHLIADGWTTKIVIDRLSELYNVFLRNEPLPAAVSATYLDFVAKEYAYLHSAQFARDESFWQKNLPILPEPLILQKYQSNSQFSTPRSHIYRVKLQREFYDALQQWASQQQATIYHVLLSGLAVYFARAQQQQQITVGVPVLNRSGALFKQVLGMFVSLSPLLINIEVEKSPKEIVSQLTAAIRQLHKHQRYPLSAIHQRLKLLKNKRDSLFDLVLSYEHQEYMGRFGDAQIKATQLFSGVARYPLAVTVCEFNATADIELVLEGAETCFNPQELAWLGDRFKYVLQQFMELENLPVSEIDLVPAAEKSFIVDHFNQQQTEPEFVSILDQFRHWVMQTPEAIAIRQHGYQLSYQQMDHLSDHLGRELQQRNCSVGDLIAVCMPRCIEAIISLLAILKIRGVYLPIDHDCPLERISSMLCRSQASALLVISSAIPPLTPCHENTISVDQLQISPVNHNLIWPEAQANDLAYVIFTSGSTGQPKGTKVHQLALSVRLAWLQNAFKIQPNERVGQSIQTHFDPSLIEILLALTQGACLVLIPGQRLLAEEFADFVIHEKINALALVPSSLRLLLQGLPPTGVTPLRVVCCGGETLPASLAKAFIVRTGAQLFNVYGPTEATILASAWQCSLQDDPILPIGKPLNHTKILIVDQHARLLPVAVPGEIIIGGHGVGKGYLGQDELTAKAFVSLPELDLPVTSFYRTGDRGYIGTDGQLHFSERLDRQVKISGYRIEPAEIEAVLMQHPAVRQAAVHLVMQEHKMLVAYVESGAVDKTQLTRDLATFLRIRLPDYMQPKAIMVLDLLPITAIGKIDYAQLPNPPIAVQAMTQRLPATALEADLLRAWQKTLKNSNLGVEDNFFEQDTDSLTAISLITAIEKITGFRQSIAFLMAFPTVAMQAEQLEQTSEQISHPSCVTLSAQRSQTHLYLAASGDGDQLRFQALADALGKDCMLHALYPPRVYDTQATIEIIAKEYAKLIMQNQHEQFCLAGFSIGGVTALETARILALHGCAPNKLILLDTVFPRRPLQSLWVFKVLQWLSGCFIFKKFSFNGRELQVILNDPGIGVQVLGLKKHRIQAYSGPTLLVQSRQMRFLRQFLFTGWFRLLGKHLEKEYVPGLHGAMFRPQNLPQLSQTLKRCLQVI